MPRLVLTTFFPVVVASFRQAKLASVPALDIRNAVFSVQPRWGWLFAAGWTPCIGPILGGIIGLAATSGGWRSGLVLSAFYSAGLAVPFLLTGLGINQFLGFYKNFRRHLHKVEVVSGVILILVGLLVMSGQSTLLASSRFMAWIPNAEGLLSFGEKTPPPAPAPANTNFEPAPDVEFQTLAGQPFRLKDAYQEEVAKFEYQVLGGSDAKVNTRSPCYRQLT